ncbi:helix-turn-helix domain-containing protein [Myroides sp. C15-4]|uniref:helix-turn-helix domain-containing protein n=1 Tax=Myroides sp. C15-4 TaxID=3400532 RepID=UPI003D2F75EB
MDQLQILQCSPEQLRQLIKESIKNELEAFKEFYQPQDTAIEFMTRKEVAECFKVNLSTIHNWCKNGKLIPHAIGNRIYFKRDEVINSLVCLKL